MAIQYVASLPLTGLCIPTFGLYLSVMFELALQLSAAISLSLSLGISLTLPTIALGLSIALALIIQFQLALGLTLPSLSLNLHLALSFELGIVIGLLATLEAILNAVASVSLEAYAYSGTGAAFGPAVTSSLASGWSDGTPAGGNVKCVIFAATTTGGLTPDQVDRCALVAPPPTPPTPPPPSPPAGSYPPPQAYEHGLATVLFPSAIHPAVVYPSDPATGHLVIDNSVSTGIGKVTSIVIDHHGSGYQAPAFCVISDTVTATVAVATPPVLTLPSALSVPIGQGLGITVSGAQGTTTVAAATASSPIVVTVPSTANLNTCTISGALGDPALNGQWHCNVLSPTTAALWLDAEYSIPSTSEGTYVTGSARLTGNVNGLQFARVLSPTTIALYQDQGLSVPVVAYDTAYTGASVTGGGMGAVGNVLMGGGAQNSLSSFFNGLVFPKVGLEGGSITFKAMCSATFEALFDLLINLGTRKGLLLAASASASASVTPPSISASLELLAKIVATLKANLTVKLPSLQASASAALSAQVSILLSLVAAIGAQLSLGLESAGLEFEVYTYSGPGSGLGQAISETVGTKWHDGTPSSANVGAVLFGLTTSASADAFAAFFPGVT